MSGPSKLTVIQIHQAARVHCYPEPGDVRLSGADQLTKYSAFVGSAYFCSVCGSATHVSVDEPITGMDGQEVSEREPTPEPTVNIVAVNVRCLHGVDVGEIGANRYDGRAKPPIYSVE